MPKNTTQPIISEKIMVYKNGKVNQTTTATIRAGIHPSTKPKKLNNMIAVIQVPKNAIMALIQAPSKNEKSLLSLINSPNNIYKITIK